MENNAKNPIRITISLLFPMKFQYQAFAISSDICIDVKIRTNSLEEFSKKCSNTNFPTNTVNMVAIIACNKILHFNFR